MLYAHFYQLLLLVYSMGFLQDKQYENGQITKMPHPPQKKNCLMLKKKDNK